MGCTKEQGGDCSNDEYPAHSVTVSSFYMMKYEVTQGLWKAVMGGNPSWIKGDNVPVTNVRWGEVQAFIKKLNAKTGKKYRLPTEAEWEYAARGGKSGKGYMYSGGDNIDVVAWYDKNSGSKPHPVGEKAPNELGIYDLSGNVAEWVNDRYGDYTTSDKTNPKGPNSGSDRVFRGCGSYFGFAESCRVSYRGASGGPDFWVQDLGFRLVLDP
jgi:formylglycine-generating enzyme required for sulfatase activity